jgi:hypothetical protein
VSGDPGTGGKKLSKSDSGEKLEARNKSFNKVLDLQIAYVRMVQSGKFDGIPTARHRWKAKAEWHEKEFGW